MNKTILLSGSKNQYKANLHCHSVHSDGKLTPETLKNIYRDHGYSVLAITDHCTPKKHTELTDESFLMLTGYEAYIRPDPKGNYNSFKPEVHLNLFAKDPNNEALICYNPHYTKYLPKEKHGELIKKGSEEPREYTSEYINKFIETAIKNGYLVAYNHPFWSMETEERILSYENLFSFEMYNTGSYITNNLENGEMLYDVMMRRGMRLGCHAGDDNHNTKPLDSPYSDSFGFYTMILADKLEYSEIIDALEKKECYASSGPLIKEISISKNDEGVMSVHIECSPASKAFMFFGSKAPKSVRLPKGETSESFDFTLHNDAEYFRITVYGEDGSVANSRGFFKDEWGF